MPKKPPLKPSGAVFEMMKAEFDEKPFGVAGEMIVSNPPPQTEPVPEFVIPPPPWSEHYRPELDPDATEPEPELRETNETETEPLPAVEIPAPPWAERP